MSSPLEDVLIFGNSMQSLGFVGLEFNNVTQTHVDRIADGIALATLGMLWAWNDIWIKTADDVSTSWTSLEFAGTTTWTDI